MPWTTQRKTGPLAMARLRKLASLPETLIARNLPHCHESLNRCRLPTCVAGQAHPNTSGPSLIVFVHGFSPVRFASDPGLGLRVKYREAAT